MGSSGVTVLVLLLFMHSLANAVHTECNAVMLGPHFMPLQFLQLDLCLLSNAERHSTQPVDTLCASSSSGCLNAQGLHHG